MIKLSGVIKRYKMPGHQINALNDISLEIKKGEFVSITGRSGSGKSTLMNILGCLDQPCEGEYILDGDKVFNSKASSTKNFQKLLSSNCQGGGSRLASIRNQKIGFVFQSFNLVSYLTARENIELPLIYRKTPRLKRERLVSEALEMVGLSDRGTHKPHELSGGQQQRVAIARAIAAKPPLILADEPCGNLDSRMGYEIMAIFRGLNQNGRTIVLITHDANAAKQTDRIISIADGRVV